MRFTRTGGTMSLKLSKLLFFVSAVSLLASTYLWYHEESRDVVEQHTESRKSVELAHQRNRETVKSHFKAKVPRKRTVPKIVFDATSPVIPYAGVETYVRHKVSRLNLKTLEIEPLIPRFGTVLNDVTSFRYPVEPHCRSASTGRMRLFIAIISAPDYFDKRQTIRNTWLRLFDEPSVTDSLEVVGHAFVVGNPKNHSFTIENETYGDLLHIDFQDSYKNLTLKTVALMNWLRNKCSVDYVLKVDDDVYVNVRNLISVITSSNASERQIFGLGLTSPPLRRGRWAVGYDEWPWSEYPYYVAGAVQLISGDSIAPLLAASQVIPFLPFEDLYLTGVCAEMADVDLVDSPGMLAQTNETVRDSVAWLMKSNCGMYKLHVDVINFYEECIKEQDNNIDSNGIDPCAPNDFDFIRHSHH